MSVFSDVAAKFVGGTFTATLGKYKLAAQILFAFALVSAILGVGYTVGVLAEQSNSRKALDLKEVEVNKWRAEVTRLQGEAITSKAAAEKALAKALSDVDAEKTRSAAERKKLLNDFLNSKRSPTLRLGSSLGSPSVPTTQSASSLPCFTDSNVVLINQLLEKSRETNFFADPNTTP